MGFASEVLELLLDSKHIANKPPGPGAGNWEIWRACMRLKRPRLSNGGGDVHLLGVSGTLPRAGQSRAPVPRDLRQPTLRRAPWVGCADDRRLRQQHRYV